MIVPVIFFCESRSIYAETPFRLGAPKISLIVRRNETKYALIFRFVSFRFVQNIWYRISFRFVFTGSPQAELGALYINKASKMIDFSRGCPRASASNLWSHFVSFRFVLRQAPVAALPFRFVSFRFGRKRMFRLISSGKRKGVSA